VLCGLVQGSGEQILAGITLSLGEGIIPSKGEKERDGKRSSSRMKKKSKKSHSDRLDGLDLTFRSGILSGAGEEKHGKKGEDGIWGFHGAKSEMAVSSPTEEEGIKDIRGLLDTKKPRAWTKSAPVLRLSDQKMGREKKVISRRGPRLGIHDTGFIS